MNDEVPAILRTDSTASLESTFVNGYGVRIGDLTISVHSSTPSLALDLPGGLAPFVDLEPNNPDLSLRVRTGKIDEVAPGTLLFDSGGVWSLHRTSDRYVYRFVSPSFGPMPYKEARIGLDFAAGEIVLNRDAFDLTRPVDALQFPLDEILFIRLLAERGGIELHACGVKTPNGEGYVFAGQSGDGKTTTARLWERLEGAEVLSDDRIIVRRDRDRRWMMCGTPWHGEAELATNCCTALTAVMILERGTANRLVEMEPIEAVAGLLARSFVPFHDERLMDETVRTLGSIVDEVPCHRLAFVPDTEVVRFVHERTWPT